MAVAIEAALAQIRGVNFGFFTDSEIKELSVVHVVNPVAFDIVRTPLPGGLYDPKMGPIDRFDVCETCKLSGRSCPGHFGHIELPFPVYNPFVFQFMFRLLQCTCFNCGKFKMAVNVAKHFETRFKLIKEGNLQEAFQLPVEDLGKKGEEPDFGASQTTSHNSEGLRTMSERSPQDATALVLEAYQDTVSAFLKKMATDSKCRTCSAVNPKLKKEGYTKIFTQPLSKRQKEANKSNNSVLVSPTTRVVLGERGGLDFLTSLDVLETFRNLWSKEKPLLDLICGGMNRCRNDGYKAFFLSTLAVTPNCFRPPSFSDGLLSEHAHNALLSKIITLCMDIRGLSSDQDSTGQYQIGEVAMYKWQQLQGAASEFIDSSSVRNTTSMGIRQFIEKKEGLFRKNMMGKRVNYACRSTISPDPYLNVGEIGVPPYFAKNLSFPEVVTPWNAEKLRKLVERGADEYPGALSVEDSKGRVISLARMPKQNRVTLARTLYQGWDGPVGDAKPCMFQGRPVGSVRIVNRHLKDGDLMLTNRQPTLHKASLMAHKAKVLHGERTIRFHYANCATFNADFDGDEINLHLPQDNLCRAEGYGIIHADHQYIIPTNGQPVRGLIQDSVDAGVLLTMRDTFLTKKDYMQLVYAAIASKHCGEKLCNLNHDEVGDLGIQEGLIHLEEPTYVKPGPYWTGKQVVSTVLRNIVGDLPALTMSAKCKTPTEYWADPIEGFVCFRQGVLVHGVIDKAQYGSRGLVHACQEIYGNHMAGILLSSLGRLFVQFLQMHGFTCGIGDCFLESDAEDTRADLVKLAEWKALESSAKVIGRSVENSVYKSAREQKKDIAEVTKALSMLYRQNKDTGAVHDAAVKGPMHQLSSQVVKSCLPEGISRQFRQNCLTIMTTTGAKGSFVNFSQISCLLGQQELEGRRVPRMMSGKTLPCFAAFDPRARSSGFIQDRFLSGLRPPEYYFHCMAGREGLVDTSVKTANSGYLQRCLVKCMESICIQYDGTVRDDSDGSIFQFLYGEDGLDVINTSYLKDLKFIAENGEGFKQKLSLEDAVSCSKAAGVDKLEKKCQKLAKRRMRNRLKGKSADLEASLPINESMRPTLMGATSEKFLDSMHDYITQNSDGLLMEASAKHLSPSEFQSILELKYMEALAAPGEAVGVIAAQSIGEPSTQMTLNTFHMAGRGEANVTLGIPRLREILMSAAVSIKTPIMTLPLKPGRALSDAQEVANKLRKIRLSECLKGLRVEEHPVARAEHSAAGYSHLYKVILTFHPISAYPPEVKLTWEDLTGAFEGKFIPKLSAAIKAELKRLSAASQEVSVVKTTAGGDAEDSGGQSKIGSKAKNKYEDDEENEENVEGRAQYRGGRSEEQYDAPDDEDRKVAKSAAEEVDRKFGDLEDKEDETDGDGHELSAAKGSNEDTGDGLSTPQSSQTAQGISDYSRALVVQQEVEEGHFICTAKFELPLDAPKLLMLGIAEGVAAVATTRENAGIDKCYVVEGEKGKPHTVQTDGINFHSAYAFDDLIDVDRISANDISAMREFYGVEAARSTIVDECRGVFGAYGIGVDPRHLGLISDHMTNLGGYRPLNRVGISTQISPLLKMSFETATNFLRQATLGGDVDSLQSPAARVAVGRPPLLGTGCMDILHRFV